MTEGDADYGTVFVNDPLAGEGAGKEVPLAVFESAWAGSNHSMIVTDKPARSGLAYDVAEDESGTGTAVEEDAAVPGEDRIAVEPLLLPSESEPVVIAEPGLCGPCKGIILLPLTLSTEAWERAPLTRP